MGDKLWDGTCWVTHQGVLSRGVRTVIEVAGLLVTPEHLILCGNNTWQVAQSLLSVQTPTTAAPWPSTNKKLSTYDIACSGPRNRFTVVTVAGPLIVHNCGYGAGSTTIQHTAARGTYGPPVKIDLDTARAWRDLYRSENYCVPAYWKHAERALRMLAAGQSFSWSLFHLDGSASPKTVRLPNGCPLLYPSLHWHTDESGDSYWRYKSRSGFVKLWGGSFVENLIQAIARVDMSQTLLRIHARDPAIKFANLEHDAAAAVVPLDNVARVVQIFQEEFCRPPAWCPDIPLACEVTVGESYG